MTTSRQPLDAFAIALMIMLCLLWGMQQVAVKVAAGGMLPVMQIGVRSLVAALCVYALIFVRGGTVSMRDGTFWPGMAVGLLFSLEFFCVAFGLQFTTASHMSVFLYTAPIFTVLGLHWIVPGERLKFSQWIGVLIAFAGIGVAFSNGFSEPSRDWVHVLIGDMLGVAGGALWAATTVLIRRSALSEAPPATTLLYQLGSSGILLIALAALMGQASSISMTGIVWTSLFFQSVIVAFISYLIWFWMLRKYLASRLSAFSFLTPMFGVAFGVLLLNDPLSMRFIVGAALVLIGVVMVNLRGR
ncbi:DMT family transporter [Noviherbaspirillum cavernae]|uniref:DMT family transporter n=1 Tax=Noviherbaspirillum cavernae TaxID=2320862 RepID=A0A418WZS4_9BURK|nr:DMT family transporter [Noviherbaspirillum cavernae]RJG05747.1 DMT family transporter [Noviherbaspirillum cavernae]